MRTKAVSSTLVLALAGVLALSGCRKEANDDSNVAKDPTSGAATDAMPGPAATPPASDQAAQGTATGAASTDNAAMAGAGVTVSSVTVSSVAVGTVAAADKTVKPSASVGSKDTIIVSVKTEGSASNVPVSAKLTYQDGQVAGEQSATLTTSGAETTNMRFSKPDGWPAGTYTAQVMVDGKPAGTPRSIIVK